MARSEEYLDEFFFQLQELDNESKQLVLDGDVEICPCCNELSAYAWDLCNAYEELDIISRSFKPARGTIAHIGNCSAFEWECGHCHAHLAERDSPINHPCYTHE